MFSHGFMSFAAIGVTVACLLIMGSFSLLTLNIDANIDRLQNQNEVIAYVDETLTEDEARAIEPKVAAVANVASVEFITREQAMQTFEAEYDSDLFDNIDASVFRHRYVVTLDDLSLMKDTQAALKNVDGIVIHYTANPGSTAMQNRDYFENLPETQEAQASSHFVVGIEGEVVQCIPTSEWSYASNQRNFDTISIECCHPDDSGEFTDETYNSVVQLAGFLCKRFNLTSDDVIRHYDVTEKLCPLYYVEHENAWIQMKADIQAYADSLS